MKAHELYLKGRYLWNTRDGVSMQKSIDFFRGALREDSTYALAWSGLADAYALVTMFGDGNPRALMPLARDAALRALALDSALAEAHTSLGMVNMFYDWDWHGAERRFARAVEINPDYATAHLFRAWYFMFTHAGEAAVSEVRRARELEPLSLIIGTRVASMLYFTGRYREADAELQKVFDVNPSVIFAQVQKAQILTMEGRGAEALAVMPRSGALETNNTGDIGTLGMVYVAAGQPDSARALGGTLIKHRASRNIPADCIAMVYAQLNDREAAFAWLNRALEEHAVGDVFAGIEPEFAPLHKDPRWPALLARLGLSP